MGNLLKDVMIDAKVVKETALANARAALAEAFSPKLEAMFSEKLKEFEGDDENADLDLTSDVPVDDVAPEAPVADAPVGDAPAPDVAPEAPVADAPVGDTPAPVADVPVEEPVVKEEKDVALKGAPKGAKTEDSVGVNGQTKQAVGKDEKSQTPAFSGKAGSEPSKQPTGEKTKDSVGVNGQTKQAVGKDEKSQTPALNEELNAILKELESDEDDISFDELGDDINESKDGEDEDEEINLDEVISSLTEEKEEDESEEDEKDEEKEALIKENEEYKRAIVFLKDRINEVNLLNAKLLYTNKLFKEASLNNAQKAKIVEGMDRAKTVREVKYAYSLLAESLNFGAKKPVIKESSSSPVKKVASEKKIVSTITEGLASKPVASTKPSQKALLTEGDLMAQRFQKLAGIKKR